MTSHLPPSPQEGSEAPKTPEKRQQPPLFVDMTRRQFSLKALLVMMTAAGFVGHKINNEAKKAWESKIWGPKSQWNMVEKAVTREDLNLILEDLKLVLKENDLEFKDIGVTDEMIAEQLKRAEKLPYSIDPALPR